MVYPKLEKEFYNGEDVVQLSRELLGKFLFTQVGGILTGGMIVETEAYNGRCDKACHANDNRRTKRTEVMYDYGGRAYVYLCYGIHHLFNITTNTLGKADAILIRGIEPVVGIEEMLLRRNMSSLAPRLTAGPGVLSQSLGITTKLYGEDLTGSTVWVEDRNISLAPNEIVTGPRIGVAYAEEDALLPWRFTIRGNKWVSKGK